MKKKINRYEVTEQQKQAIESGIAALGQICQAHKAANPHHSTFEIRLKVTHERLPLQPFDAPAKTWGFFEVGNFFDGGGCGNSIESALHEMFSKTDADEKRSAAKRCRDHADQLEREAKDLEVAATQ